MARPRYMVPQYGGDQARNIMNVTNALANLVGDIGNAVRQYKANRSLDTAYKGVRGLINANKEDYGLSDSQAEAMMNRLKYREGEEITDYEDRIRPTLQNLVIYDNLKKEDPGMADVDLPDPFIDNKVFVSLLDRSVSLSRQSQLGEHVPAVTGQEPKLPLEPGQTIGQQIGEQPQKQFATTQEEASQMIAGRMGGAVSQKELKQYPGYRNLPTQAGIATGEMKQEKHEADIAAQEALTTQRHTQTKKINAEINKLRNTPDKKTAVNNVKTYAEVTRLDLGVKTLLNKMEPIDPVTGELDDEYIEVKALSQELSKRRKFLEKALPQPQEKEQIPYSPRHEEQRLSEKREQPLVQPIAGRVQGVQGVQGAQTPVQAPPMPEGQNEELQVQRISKNYGILPQRIKEARKAINDKTGQPFTFEEIIARIEQGAPSGR